jgi:hypothetical protein
MAVITKERTINQLFTEIKDIDEKCMKDKNFLTSNSEEVLLRFKKWRKMLEKYGGIIK